MRLSSVLRANALRNIKNVDFCRVTRESRVFIAPERRFFALSSYDLLDFFRLNFLRFFFDIFLRIFLFILFLVLYLLILIKPIRLLILLILDIKIQNLYICINVIL